MESPAGHSNTVDIAGRSLHPKAACDVGSVDPVAARVGLGALAPAGSAAPPSTDRTHHLHPGDNMYMARNGRYLYIMNITEKQIY